LFVAPPSVVRTFHPLRPFAPTLHTHRRRTAIVLVRRQLGIHALQRIASSTSEKALMEQVEVLHNQIAKLQAAMKKGRTEAQQRVQETLVEAERAHTERRKAQSERLETQQCVLNPLAPCLGTRASVGLSIVLRSHSRTRLRVVALSCVRSDLQDARDMVRPMKELLALPLSERVQTLESAYEACGGGSEETEARRLQELEVKAAVTAAEAAREKARAKAAELSELDKCA